MSKERLSTTTSGLPGGEEVKEFARKWGVRLGLVAVALLGLAWLL